MAHDVRLAEARYDAPEVVAFVRALGAEVEARYGEPDLEPDVITVDTFSDVERGAFYVAWIGDTAVGCGALRRFDETTGEVKRMYVEPAVRRAGVARAVLRALEARAAELGYGRLVLETGTAQPEAMALYESEGWSLMPPYGTYADHPTSRCYTKRLVAMRRRRGR